MKCKKGFKKSDGKCEKVNYSKIKQTMKFKNWWKEHWDEVILIGGLIIGGYFLLKAVGII